jgi:hypothetical protein
MPAKSARQRKFFGAVVAYKKGKLRQASREVREAARTLTLKTAKEFARKGK